MIQKTKTLAFKNANGEADEEAMQIEIEKDKKKKVLRDIIDPETGDFKRRHYYLFYKLNGSQCLLSKLFGNDTDVTKT